MHMWYLRSHAYTALLRSILQLTALVRGYILWQIGFVLLSSWASTKPRKGHFCFTVTWKEAGWVAIFQSQPGNTTKSSSQHTFTRGNLHCPPPPWFNHKRIVIRSTRDAIAFDKRGCHPSGQPSNYPAARVHVRFCHCNLLFC